MKTLIVTGGDINLEQLKEYGEKYKEQNIIAVDKGLEELSKLNIRPTHVVGDFDSISKEKLEHYQGNGQITFHEYRPEKDNTDTDIINFDAYFYSENVQNYSEKLKIFLQNGGFLALGIVPTIDLEALSSLNINILYKKFEEAINILSKDIDKNLIIEQCFITPGCGCGSLSIDLAKKASILTKELSQTLKKEIRINI